jgi:hypothetical protein
MSLVVIYQGECISCGCIVEADKAIVHSPENLYKCEQILSEAEVIIKCPTVGCPCTYTLFPKYS